MKVDLVLVGGGLANCLIAWRLQMSRPELDIRLIESGAALGGNHTWSFHGSDLTPRQLQWMAPLIESSWSGYEVRFPQCRRHLDGTYHSLTSASLHEALTAALGAKVILASEAVVQSNQCVEIGDGNLHAKAVIDGRGGHGSPHWGMAYQKFLGLSIVTEEEHGVHVPILMDATVEQRDGFRFLYTLPLSNQRLLVEDTRYSDTPILPKEEMRAEIRAYAAGKGWTIAAVEREEIGALPIVLEGRLEGLWEESRIDIPRAGVRAGLFHATTGYSLPDAVRLADDLAACDSFDAPQLCARIRSRAQRHWRRQGFYRLLNRMLFRAGEPEERYRVFQRFYGLRTGLIDRFYAGQLNIFDRARLLVGKPPVPFWKAVACIGERAAPAAHRVDRTDLAGPE